ncbi:DUF2218 domain-containing protein [Nocardia sp. NPDC059240]|uniref:DUF2218 domain-containing protein n=1 Tax=Nocardia sp. NPDC059240 TaxID=3346786 RepID=UPI0036C194E1
MESRIPTDRPARYLRQFRTHAEAMASPRGHRLRSHAGKPHSPTDVQLRVEGTDERATAHFDPWGTCLLTATPDALLIRIDAADTASLDRLRDLVTADLTRFGRGTLSIEWHPAG